MRVLIPLPERDFDPSEVAVSWAVLRAAAHRRRVRDAATARARRPTP